MQAAKDEIKAAKIETEGLSRTGVKILEDTERVIETAQEYIEEKNPDEQLQKLVWEGKKATEELERELERLKTMQGETLNQIDSERLKNLLVRTMETARLAGFEIMSSPSFRNNVKDFVKFIADVISESIEDTGR